MTTPLWSEVICARAAAAPTSFGPYTALRFTSFFSAPYSALYNFKAHGADGAIVWLGDQSTPFLAGNGAALMSHTAVMPAPVPTLGQDGNRTKMTAELALTWMQEQIDALPIDSAPGKVRPCFSHATQPQSG